MIDPSSEKSPGEKLFAVKAKINEMKRDLEHRDHLDFSSGEEKILTERAARAILRAALHELEGLL